MKAIVNGTIITNGNVIHGKTLLFDKTIIGLSTEECLQNCEIVDAQGQYVSAGFIDIHMHGCNGIDFSYQVQNKYLEEICKKLPMYGVTSFLPTLISLPNDQYNTIFPIYREFKKTAVAGAEILGIHMEGPMISSDYRGAHSPSHIGLLPKELILENSDLIKFVTLAPELDGIETYVELLKQFKIQIAAGHTAMTMNQAKNAYNNGIKHCTHLFNAMLPFKHRELGLVGEVLMNHNYSFDIVADNIHLFPSLYQFIFNNVEKEKMILITDAIFASGLGDGTYIYDNRRFVIRENKITTEEGILAGSILTLNKAVYNVLCQSQISLADIVNMVTINPARLLQIEGRKGSLECGKDADIVMFDKEINIKQAFINGKNVYNE